MWRLPRMSKTSSGASATRSHRSRSSSSTPAPGPNTASRTMSIRDAGWVTSHHVPAGARGAADRHRRLELGRAVRPYRKKIRRDGGCQPDLGGPQGWTPHRLLSYRKVAQSGAAALDRLHGLVLPGQDRARLGWLDPGGSHHRRMSPQRPAPTDLGSAVSRLRAPSAQLALTVPSRMAG